MGSQESEEFSVSEVNPQKVLFATTGREAFMSEIVSSHAPHVGVDFEDLIGQSRSPRAGTRAWITSERAGVRA